MRGRDGPRRQDGLGGRPGARSVERPRHRAVSPLDPSTLPSPVLVTPGRPWRNGPDAATLVLEWSEPITTPQPWRPGARIRRGRPGGPRRGAPALIRSPGP